MGPKSIRNATEAFGGSKKKSIKKAMFKMKLKKARMGKSLDVSDSSGDSARELETYDKHELKEGEMYKESGDSLRTLEVPEAKAPRKAKKYNKMK